MACYNLDILLCPACQAGHLNKKGDALVCAKCSVKFELRDGIPLLLTDKTLVTQLEKIDYDEHHGIDDARRIKTAEYWKGVFDKYGVCYGDVLEIGSGTGQLTWGLARKMSFRSVSACDISYKFLNGVRGKLLNQPADSHVSYYACDANKLPFRPGSFDLILGHSVLHHFVDYDHTIQQSFHLLRADGKAIFYEPVLQGKAWIAFMGDLMVRIEKRIKWGVLDEKDIAKIEHMVRHITKAKFIGDDRARLMQMEDKHIFDINQMRELSQRLGFSDFAYHNFHMADWGYKTQWAQHLLMLGIAAEKIQKFAFISQSFGDVFSDLLPNDIVTPMGYFIFTK